MTDGKKAYVGIGFWPTAKGSCLMSHSGGLTQEQVDYLKAEIKVGGRLVLFINNAENEDRPDLTLQVSTLGGAAQQKPNTYRKPYTRTASAEDEGI